MYSDRDSDQNASSPSTDSERPSALRTEMLAVTDPAEEQGVYYYEKFKRST